MTFFIIIAAAIAATIIAGILDAILPGKVDGGAK